MSYKIKVNILQFYNIIIYLQKMSIAINLKNNKI